MDITTAQFLVVVIGITATMFSAGFCWYFWLGRKMMVARVVSYMLGAEAIAHAVATYFSLSSLLNVYNTMTPEETIVLRLIIFSTGLASSIKLAVYVILERERVTVEDNDNRNSKVEKNRDRY